MLQQSQHVAAPTLLQLTGQLAGPALTIDPSVGLQDLGARSWYNNATALEPGLWTTGWRL